MRSVLLQGFISLGEVLELEPSNQAAGDDSDAGSHSDTPSHSQQSTNGLSPAPTLRRSSLHSHSGTLPVIHSFGEQGLWEPDSPSDDHRLVYQHGKACDVYTLILQGRVLVRTGATIFSLKGPPSHVSILHPAKGVFIAELKCSCIS